MSHPAEFVLVDGRLAPAGTPVLRGDDRGFLHGDGAFETIRLEDGHPQGWRWHLERLSAALKTLEIDAPMASLLGWLRALVVANRGAEIVRISVSRGWGEPPTATVLMTARAAPARGPVALASLDSARALAGLKSLSYLPAVLARRRCGEAEPLFVEGGYVLEGATTNLFARVEDTLVTPPADGRILPGVMRRAVLAVGAVEQRPLTRTEVLGWECFVTNAVIGLVPVVSIDGHALARPGPWLNQLREDALALLALDDGRDRDGRL